MLARCARCQNTFTTDRFGIQTCPHCGSEVLLSDPNAPAAPPAQPAPPAPGTSSPSWGAPPAPPPGFGAPPPGAGAAPPGAPPPPPGRPPGAQPSEGGWGSAPHRPVAPPPPGWERSAPFVDRSRIGFLASYVQTWKLVAFDPAQFFRYVRIAESRSAVLFGVVALTLGNWFQTLYGYAVSSAAVGLFDDMLGKIPQGRMGVDHALVLALKSRTTFAGVLAQLVMAPLAALFVLYLTAGVMHLLLLLFRAAPRGFDATLTAVGYAFGLFVLQAVPVCGYPVAAIWFLGAVILGLGETQRCGPGKAAAAALLPLGFVCFCCGGAVATMLAGLGTISSQGE
ncbi:YIP1 family protein [Anaeromyxobacter paludicola]|uniref:Yip1 domain-containing protein n=1 Tax=Anaeromyxobacter paludicola TaxID=2918171 RepID=A0ABN6N9G9_9BACT|nr:YIP1 family protein [Anaeromyxobacter paludicola]BDG09890.1 hypothetical protein AMPC_30030 [Anaeromyxobacter paludicola]